MAIARSPFTRVTTPNASADVQVAVNDIYDKLALLSAQALSTSPSPTVVTPKKTTNGTGTVVSSGTASGVGIQNPILPQSIIWQPFNIGLIAPAGHMAFLAIQQRSYYTQFQKQVYLRIYLYNGIVSGVINNQFTLSGGIPVLCADGDPQALSSQVVDGNGFYCGGYAVIQNVRGQAVITCGRADGANFQLGGYLAVSITGVYQGA